MFDSLEHLLNLQLNMHAIFIDACQLAQRQRHSTNNDNHRQTIEPLYVKPVPALWSCFLAHAKE